MSFLDSNTLSYILTGLIPGEIISAGGDSTCSDRKTTNVTLSCPV